MDSSQFRELASAVVRHLPEIGRDEAQLLIDQQHRLAAILRNAFQTPRLRQFPVVFGVLDLSEVEDHFGTFFENAEDFKTSRVPNYTWPDFTGAPSATTIHFIKLNYSMTGVQAKEELKKVGLRPATWGETLYFFVQSEHLIKGGVHAHRNIILDPNELRPMVILDHDDEAIIIEKGEGRMRFCGDNAGKLFWPDATYPAIPLDGAAMAA